MSSTSRTLKRLGVATVGVSTLVATPILGMATAYAAAPTITITSQSTNSASTNNDGTDTTVKISANVVAATAPNAAVASVRFSYTPLAGTPTVIGTDTTAPYSINWTPPAGGGTFTLTADAFDSANTTPASATATKAGVVVTNNASSVHFLTPAEGGQIGVFNGKIAVSGSRSADFPALSVTSQTRDNTTGVLSAAGAATVVPATTGGASWSAVVASPTCAAVAPATCDSVITVATTGGVNGNSDEVTQATQYAQTLTTAPQFVVTPASANKPNNGTQDYVATLTDQNGKPVGGVKTTAGTSGPGTIVTSPTSTDGKGTATYTGTAGATAATTTYTFQTAIGGGAFVAGTDFSRTATLTSYAPVATSATLTATPAKSLYAAQTEYPPVVEFCTVDQNGNGITATGPQVVAATRTRTDSTTVGTPTAVPAVTTPETRRTAT
jgi:hypothetical protein